MDEAKAIKLCIAHRDPAGFEFLVNRFRKEALFHAVTFLENYEDAADACQESFHKAFIAMKSVKKMDRFYPWFYVILKNHCLNLIRKKEKHAQGRAEIYRSGVRSPDTEPGRFLEREEETQKIWSIVRGLKTEYREILMMKYAMRKNYNEMAITLGIPRGTVMSRLYHARRAFKDKYLEAYPDIASDKKKGGKNGRQSL